MLERGDVTEAFKKVDRVHSGESESDRNFGVQISLTQSKVSKLEFNYNISIFFFISEVNCCNCVL